MELMGDARGFRRFWKILNKIEKLIKLLIYGKF
jgi:hypothetical protein